MLTTQTSHPDLAGSSALRALENERRLELLLDYYPLPAPQITGRPERVHVVTHSTDDLLGWLEQLGGRVHVDCAGGMEMWTLRTVLPSSVGRPELPVWVSAPLPAGELVADELRAAVVPPAPRPAVDGPFRIGVVARPVGVGLDVSHYLTHVVTALARAAEDEPESLLSDLQDIAALARSASHQGSDSHAAHERDERVEQLVDEIADGGVLPVYGPRVGRLADRLRESDAAAGRTVAA